MDIFELRAYIGKNKLLFTKLFTSRDAASKEAARLRKINPYVEGNISRLVLEGESFEFAGEGWMI